MQLFDVIVSATINGRIYDKLIQLPFAPSVGITLHFWNDRDRKSLFYVISAVYWEFQSNKFHIHNLDDGKLYGVTEAALVGFGFERYIHPSERN